MPQDGSGRDARLRTIPRRSGNANRPSKPRRRLAIIAPEVTPRVLRLLLRRATLSLCTDRYQSNYDCIIQQYYAWPLLTCTSREKRFAVFPGPRKELTHLPRVRAGPAG